MPVAPNRPGPSSPTSEKGSMYIHSFGPHNQGMPAVLSTSVGRTEFCCLCVRESQDFLCSDFPSSWSRREGGVRDPLLGRNQEGRRPPGPARNRTPS